MDDAAARLRYRADLHSMLRAALLWSQTHPLDVPALSFRPLPPPPGGSVAAGSLSDVIDHVAGNPATRQLLECMRDAASRGGASLLQAQWVLREAFGKDNAIVQGKQPNPPVGADS